MSLTPKYYGKVDAPNTERLIDGVAVATACNRFFKAAYVHLNARQHHDEYVWSASADQMLLAILNAYELLKENLVVHGSYKDFSLLFGQLPSGVGSCAFIRMSEYPYRVLYNGGRYFAICDQPYRILNPSVTLIARSLAHLKYFSCTKSTMYLLLMQFNSYMEEGTQVLGDTCRDPEEDRRLQYYFCARFPELASSSFEEKMTSHSLPRAELRKGELNDWHSMSHVFGWLLENPKAKILDIGGGEGAWAELVTSWFPDVTVTVADSGLPVCVGTDRIFPLGITSFLVLPESFDVVVMNMSLHHIPVSARQIVAALVRLVRADGVLIIRDHRVEDMFAEYAVLRAHEIFDQLIVDAHDCHFQNYRLWKQCEELLKLNAFTKVEPFDRYPLIAFPLGGVLRSDVGWYVRGEKFKYGLLLKWENAFLHNILLCSSKPVLLVEMAAARGFENPLLIANMFVAPWAVLGGGTGDKMCWRYKLPTHILSRVAIDKLSGMKLPVWTHGPMVCEDRKIRAFRVREKIPIQFRDRAHFSEYDVREEISKLLPLGSDELTTRDCTRALWGLAAQGYLQKYNFSDAPGDHSWEWTRKARDIGVTATDSHGMLYDQEPADVVDMVNDPDYIPYPDG